MKTLEQYLQRQHAKEYTGTDDNMLAAYESWLDTIDTAEMFEYAEDFAKELQKHIHTVEGICKSCGMNI